LAEDNFLKWTFRIGQLPSFKEICVGFQKDWVSSS